jgi:hypothetical protein
MPGGDNTICLPIFRLHHVFLLIIITRGNSYKGVMITILLLLLPYITLAIVTVLHDVVLLPPVYSMYFVSLVSENHYTNISLVSHHHRVGNN